MKYPKIFYNEYFIKFGNDLTCKAFNSKQLYNFLVEANHNLCILVEDQECYHRVWKEMLKLLEPIEAAGGVIYNPNNQYLMIFRRGKWDLPKGKIDKGEHPEDAALREIEEEVNIPKNLLKIIKFIDLTYHIYLQKNQYIIKTTYWYEVFCTEQTVLLKPQLAEDITAIEWLTKEEILKKDTYPSIKAIFETYFL